MGSSRSLGHLVSGVGSVRKGVAADHVAGLHDLLEPAQVVAHLLVRLLPQEAGDRTADRATGYVVVQGRP